MNKLIQRMLLPALAVVLMVPCLSARELTPQQRDAVERIIENAKPEHMVIGKVAVKTVSFDDDSLRVNLTDGFADVPFSRSTIDNLKAQLASAVGDGVSPQQVALAIDGVPIDRYFVDFDTSYRRRHAPFITELDPARRYKHGLDGNIVAVWPSHGWYFEPVLNRWEWQRARMFQTVEDMYTHSYMIPFIMPMLENAGAYVWDARERDIHNFGAVVDNDGGLAQKGYVESNGKQKWEQGKTAGFAYKRAAYRDFENPFVEGTYRMAKTVTDRKKVSTATWDVDMPQAGTYAIYVSYRSLPNSVTDAVYTVNSLDGTRQFKVDQTMGGGVWVYLGSFQLKQGLNRAVVTLSNLSENKKGVVTADAIKVGGGKGNIERRVALPTPENTAIAEKNKDTRYLGKPGINYKYVGSGEHPWFHLGSRYFLQWAGFPDSVYSTSQGINDYVDDYRSRGEWVNYLAGGSEVLPNYGGLRVPVDVSFCLHTDAGTTVNDDIIGTLLIYCTKSDGKNFGRYRNGTPREISRQFADIVSTQVVNDIRAKYEPNWTRRGMWDKSYYEARVPEVPALLMELLSHQNFADMKYGLDPMFRFDVSRSIYKGILKFIARRDHRDCVVQPLPVQAMAIKPVDGNRFELTWQPTRDELEPTADATRYVVMERVGDGGFTEVAVVTRPSHPFSINDNLVHSFKVVAMNDGGRSFPSETLSVGVPKGSKGTVMVVNGFTRVSAPDWLDGEHWAGFLDEKDHGVPYMEQINYLGAQHEFRRQLPWRDDDAPGFGACRSNHETEVIAGNTFDYPAMHGEAVMAAGYAFVSASVKAVEQGAAPLSGYTAVDLILGKQKTTRLGRGAMPDRFTAFTPALQQALRAYTEQGGNVLASGAYVATDIWDRPEPQQSDIDFAKQVLGYEYVDGCATLLGRVYTVPSPDDRVSDGCCYDFCTTLNGERYAVESPDAVRASDDRGATIMRYSENNIPAAIASDRGNYRTVVMGFPFETIVTADQRRQLMQEVLSFFTR